jgi:hypothetical protein
MGTGEWIALAALAVAVSAAVFSWRAVHHARRSADAAEQSAEATRRQAETAERTEAAHQIEWDERAGPAFDYRPHGSTGQMCSIDVILRNGQQEIDVRVTGLWLEPERPKPGEPAIALSIPHGTHRLVHNQTFPVHVDLRASSGSVTVRLDLECIEVTSQSPRRWPRNRVETFSGGPRLSAIG